MLELELNYIFKSVVGVALGYVIWKFKKVETKVEQSLDEQEIRQIIDDKLEPMKVMHKEVKEDLNRIENKLDRLIERK